MSDLRLLRLRWAQLHQKSRVVVRALHDLIAPARCMGCLREGTWLCRVCASALPDFPILRYEADSPLRGVVSAGSYGNDALRRGIEWLKFRGVADVAPALAQVLAPQLTVIAPLQQLDAHAVLVPIPLHRQRLRQRGFNQSLEIAHALGQQTGIPVADILTRKRATVAQALLPHEMRAENVEHAFEVKDSTPHSELLKSTYVLLVDDVSTTGSTLLAAASGLRVLARDAQLWGVTVARG